MSKAKSEADKPEKSAPYNFEERRIKRATEFCKAKADGGQMAPRVKLTKNGPNGKVQSEPNHSDSSGHLFSMHQAFGTGSNDFYNQQFGWLLAVMRRRTEDLPDDIAANAGIAAVAAAEPQNEVEAMLAVQMAGTHEVAMDMLSRARRTDSVDHLKRYGTLATKLLRTYTTQFEALAKIRRGGAQKVRVEHIHIHEGGQAIVGNVNTRGGGAPLKHDINPMNRQTREPLPLRLSIRCCAKTRRGTPCQTPAMRGKKRCRIHGGADGSGAPEGARNGRYRHGLRTKVAMAERRQVREICAEWREIAKLLPV